jgi:hypothetical protein
MTKFMAGRGARDPAGAILRKPAGVRLTPHLSGLWSAPPNSTDERLSNNRPIKRPPTRTNQSTGLDNSSDIELRRVCEPSQLRAFRIASVLRIGVVVLMLTATFVGTARAEWATQTVLLVLYAFACTMALELVFSRPVNPCWAGCRSRNFELMGCVVLWGWAASPVVWLRFSSMAWSAWAASCSVVTWRGPRGGPVRCVGVGRRRPTGTSRSANRAR